jgi:hypothetical protein
MKKVWISYCTEYEFGQRDVGYMVCDDFNRMENEIDCVHSEGTREQFFRYSTITEVWCTKKIYKKIMKQQAKNAHNIAHFGNNVKLKLYKKI